MAAINYLFELAGSVIVAVFLLRFFLQLTRADYTNPVAVAIARFTNPVVLPLRRVIPGWGGMDIASLVGAFVAQALVLVLLGVLRSGLGAGAMPSLKWLAIRTPFELVLMAIQLYTIMVFIRILLSWIDRGGYNPISSMLVSLTEPLLRPARKLLPPIGGFDLSPILVLVGLSVLSIFVSQDLPRLLM